MEKHMVICPGCGLELDSSNKSLDKDFNALVVCRELMFQLSYYTLSLQDAYFIHQLAVDAYAAQHSGGHTKPIATAFGLVGLYLVNEKNYSGKQVQLAHIKLAKKSKVWPKFSIPKEKNWLTVQDVVQSPDSEKQEMIKRWSKSVWEVWKSEKENVEELVKMLQ